ncbi:MAG: hypothetical protein IT171_04130 [Acidobacteria bacterium]|nr:hypothetical protein [Acidobacteriota bacterium]HMU34367.1 hypothetical protein [Pyrinomonadaceae bacterium]
MMILLQTDPIGVKWTEFGVAGGVIFVVFLILFFLLKIAPTLTATWKEIKIAEIGVRAQETDARTKEAESRTQQANGFSQLAGALSQMSSVLHDVVIEQRHATDKVMILQRVNADTSEQVMASVNELTDEIASIKDALSSRNANGTQAK